MRRRLQDLIPSMFHRRLLLLASSMLFIVAVLVAQLSALTLGQHSHLRDRAEQVLSQRKVIPTTRGQILDRYGRVLASSRAGYDIAVSYPVLSGAWAHREARLAAWKSDRQLWSELSEAGRERLAATFEPKIQAQVDELWEVLCQIGHIRRDELDRRVEGVKERVQKVASEVWLKRLERKVAEAEESDEPTEPVTFADVSQPIGEQLAAHPLVHNVDELGRLRIRQLVEQAKKDRRSVWRYVSIKSSKIRQYPLETVTLMIDRSTLPGPLKSDTPIEVRATGVGTHVLGWMRPVYREDMQDREFAMPLEGVPDSGNLAGYLAGDRIGRGGIESAMETHLRGTRGVVTEYLDTNKQQRIEPVPGKDVRLTLDIRLQARIQALMNPLDTRIGLMQTQRWHAKEMPEGKIGTPLNGAAVVLEISTGQVVAAVSVPTFSMQQLIEVPESVFQDHYNKPYLYRVTGGPTGGVYQPGSTLKPLVLAAAINDRKIGYNAHIECKGHLDPDVKTRFRCWIYNHYNGATHGPLSGAEAIARSCNIYFYTLGRRIGAKRLVWWYDQFGLGHRTHCGLGEAKGELPKLADADNPNARGFSKSAATLLGIGQGPVRWTPIQAANAYATLARGGYMLSPTFVTHPSNDTKRRSKDLAFDPRALDTVMQGLEEATNEKYGSAYRLALLEGERIFNVPDVKVYGKSGTATAVPQRIETDGDGRITRKDRIVREGDHAWFIGLVQRPRAAQPEYVVVVIVEYAGSGGAVSGPIANQILHAMRAEGYL